MESIIHEHSNYACEDCGAEGRDTTLEERTETDEEAKRAGESFLSWSIKCRDCWLLTELVRR